METLFMGKIFSCQRCGKVSVLAPKQEDALCVACRYRNGGNIAEDREPYTRDLISSMCRPDGTKLIDAFAWQQGQADHLTARDCSQDN